MWRLLEAVFVYSNIRVFAAMHKNNEVGEDARDKIADRMTSIVAAYVSKNIVSTNELPDLIHRVHSILANLASGLDAPKPANHIEKPTQDQIRKSIKPDALISFIDGKRYKLLKRQLKQHDMTPQSYRIRYGLPDSYPMTAPEYSARRATIAKTKKPRPPRAR